MNKEQKEKYLEEIRKNPIKILRKECVELLSPKQNKQQTKTYRP